MTKKQNIKEITDTRTKTIFVFGVIPALQIVHKVSLINIGSEQITRFTNLYRLFGFMPLFSTEKEKSTNNTKPEYNYCSDMHLI